MIYVSEEQLCQVEYLIDQSIQGNHVLFDPSTVRRVFEQKLSHDVDMEAAYAVEHHIERLMSEPSLSSKRAYLESLDQETYEMVIRTYFNIVENNLFESSELKH